MTPCKTDAAFAGLQTAETLTPSQRARGLRDELSLDEKISLMHGQLPLWPGLATMMALGGYSSRFWGAGEVTRLGIPGIRFTDGPRGVILEGGTTFPVSMARGAAFDPALEERVGEAIGREVRALGGNYFGGVCINLLRHPAWGRAQETYGEDPHHLGAMGAALTRGVQRHVMACAKHYALNSMENARFKVDVTVDARALHEVYLPHFRRVVEEGVSTITAFVQGAAVGAMIRGIPVVDGQYSGGRFEWLAPLPVLTGIGLIIGYALLGAGWLTMKSEGELREWAREHITIAVLVALILAFDAAVFERRQIGADLMDRLWGLVFPGLGLLAMAGVLIGVRERRDTMPFVMTVMFFIAAFLTLAVLFWPFMIPYSITVASAAAPEASLSFLFWGAGLFVLPVIAIYTAVVYWVFRGKLRHG